MKDLKKIYPEFRVKKLKNRSIVYYQAQSSSNPVKCLFANGNTKEESIENFKQKYNL